MNIFTSLLSLSLSKSTYLLLFLTYVFWSDISSIVPFELRFVLIASVVFERTFFLLGGYTSFYGVQVRSTALLVSSDSIVFLLVSY
jgi:hypothetical protein